MQSWLEGRIWVGKGAQATGMTGSLTILSSKADSNTCESFTRSELKLESVHQESPRSDVFRKRATKPLLNQRRHQKRLTWAVEKKNAVVQSPLFRWKSRSQSLEEEWRGTESMLLEVQCEVSTVSNDLGCHVICWCWSTVFSESTVNAAIYQEILEHFMLPSADKLYVDADFIFQQDLAPAHTAKGTKSWFNDHGVTVLDWPANSPDLNPIENLWGIVKRKMRDTRPNNADELKATVKETWASIPPQQCHKLITSMPRRIEAVIKAKGAPTKYWVHIQ